MSLTHICVQKLHESELAIVSATKEEYTPVEPEDRDKETNSKAAVRSLIHIPPSL